MSRAEDYQESAGFADRDRAHTLGDPGDMSFSSWLQSLFKPLVPVGPPETICVFTTADPTITGDGIAIEEDGWIIDAQQSRTVRLFEVPTPGAEQCLITYRAKMKSHALTGRAFLEMWCRFGWRGEFFSSSNRFKGPPAGLIMRSRFISRKASGPISSSSTWSWRVGEKSG